MGWKAKASDWSHHMFPDLTERMSANIAKAEAEKAMPIAHTAGAIHRPMPEGTTIEGGIRARMKIEDAN